MLNASGRGRLHVSTFVMNIIFRQFVTACAMLSLAAAAHAQNPIQLPTVTARGEVTSRTVEITGSDRALVTQVSRLVRLHGGLTETTSQADFRLRFEPVDTTAVEITIFSAGQRLWGDTLRGSSRTDSLLMAADAAVSRMLGIPGFFRSQLAFVSDRSGSAEIYTSGMLFDNVRQLTSDRSEALSPSFSPSGDTLLYTSYHGTGFPDIYRIDIRSGRRTVFAAFRGTNSGPSFSPDGNSVAMVLSSSGNSEIFIADSAGQQLRRLTRTPSLEADPTWSPDGRRLALTSDQMGRPQIYTLDTNGRALSRVRTDISRNCSEPTWNPLNPQQLAFTAAMGTEFEVAVYDFNEGKSRVVSSGAGDAVHPVWLRDGRHLIYTERTSRYNRLVVLDTQSGQRATLSPGELNNARQATWFYPR